MKDKKCDCTSCTVCAKRAAYRSLRKGEEMFLCTRCTLVGDERTNRLFEESDINELVKLDASVVEDKTNVFAQLLDHMGGMRQVLRCELVLPLWEERKDK